MSSANLPSVSSDPSATSDPRRSPRRRPRSRKRRGGPVLLVALGYLLVACASTPQSTAVRCPKVAVVYGLDTVAPVASNGAALPLEARLEGLRGSCGYDDAGLELDYSVDVVLVPAAPIDRTAVTLPYFVAVTDPDGRVLDKRVFTARISVEGARPAGSRERISQRLEAVGPEDGPGYRILIGFELPRERAIEQWRRRGI